jgi:hypothetical protein
MGDAGRLLQDLPALLEVEKGETGKVDVVKVETEVKVPLTLPWPGPNFSNIIQTVRGEDSGIKLRTAMNQIGGDLTFEKANSAWQVVADDIASMAGRSKMKKIDLRMLMVSVGGKGVWGALAEFTLRRGRKGQDEPDCWWGRVGQRSCDDWRRRSPRRELLSIVYLRQKSMATSTAPPAENRYETAGVFPPKDLVLATHPA